MYRVIDRETNEYLKDDDGSTLVVSNAVREAYLSLYEAHKQVFLEIKFEKVPEADSKREIATYHGGVNDND